MIFTVKAKVKIHLRPTTTIVEIAQTSLTSVFLLKNNKKCNAKSLIEVEELKIDCNDLVDIDTDDMDVLKKLIIAFENMNDRGMINEWDI
jgi:phosphotransferase system HPr (HPr) family protein